MQTRPYGDSGLDVPVLGFGAMRCRKRRKIRVAAYSGDGDALRFAVGGRPGDHVRFQGLQASVNLCEPQSLPLLQAARARGVGTIAKRSFAGRPWRGAFSGDAVHDEYRRRFAAFRAALERDVDDWDAFALRYAAFAPGVDCGIVGGTDVANVDRNLATVGLGPLMLHARSAVACDAAGGRHWQGLV